MSDAKFVFSFECPDDEIMHVKLNGQHIVTASHDQHGWSGMRAIEDTVKQIAKVIGADIVDVEEEVEDDE